MRALLSEQIKINKITDHTTAATSEVTSGAVDMAGYEGVLFITSFGTAAANNLVKAQQSSDDGATDGYSDLEGTSVTSGTSDEDVYIDIFRPTKRYLKLVATRGTSSTLESIYALQYNPRTLPVDNTITGTIAGEAFVTPAEGTA